MRRTAGFTIAVLGAAFIIGCENKGATPGGSAASGPAAGEKQNLRIAVIPKGLTHEFWKSVEAGARQAAAEAGNVEIVWQGPPKEDDTNQQISLVQSFISSGIDGIVLAPLSDQALLSPVKLAAGAGIPVVIIDSNLKGQVGKDYVAYVGTDNYKAGTLAGQRMAELLRAPASTAPAAGAPAKGTVLLLRYAESSASTNERERGFVDALKAAAPQVQLIDPPQYSGADVNSAKRAAENMLTAHAGKFDAVFCPNESSTEGMLLAMQDRQIAGKAKFVGFDSNTRLLDALKAHILQGLVLQNPVRMGYLGVKTMVEHKHGQKVEPRIDTGAVLVTPDNMDQPDIAKLLHPLAAK
jgi:ribose transport system substrate-binding protein